MKTGNILSFSEFKTEESVRRADAAMQKKQYLQAYQFLREALRYGGNSGIFSRAAAILNEVGDHGGAKQTCLNAIHMEAVSPSIHWELALACERLWFMLDSLELCRSILPVQPVFGLLPKLKREDVAVMCHIKLLNADSARQALFRGAEKNRLSPRLLARVERLEQLLTDSTPSFHLREWLHVMRGHVLLVSNDEDQLTGFQGLPEGRGDAPFAGEHFVIAHLNYHDCGIMLNRLRVMAARDEHRYEGVFSVEPSSLPVAMAVSELLSLPLLDHRQTCASSRVLLCLSGNRVAPLPPLRRLPPRHDLFILGKSFECEEYYDVVQPPFNNSYLHAWTEPINTPHRQIIGAIGENVVLPWDEVPSPGKKMPAPSRPTKRSSSRRITTPMPFRQIARLLIEAVRPPSA
ncbi:MAG: hypothetical protein PHV34_18835 [Verrucomicrobiae bacterium]|nr:hypothetical protein [Verrucomicrobiae bacterium]